MDCGVGAHRHSAHGRHQIKPARADEPCAQLEFQSRFDPCSKEDRNPKVEARKRPRPPVSDLGFRNSAFFRPSAFGLRVSLVLVLRPSAFKAPPVPISLTPRFSGVWCARAGRKPFQRFPGMRDRNGPFNDPACLALADQETPQRKQSFGEELKLLVARYEPRWPAD